MSVSAVERTSQAIARLIREDELGSGDRLPSETQLTERFAVSRATVREAVKLLEQQGLIRTEHGRGRFVSAVIAVERPITTYESLSEMLRRAGFLPVAELLSTSICPAEPEIAKALGIQPKDALIRIERLQRHGEEPLVHCIEHVPLTLLGQMPAAAELKSSLNQLLSARGLKPTMSTASVSAALLPEPIASARGLGGRGPWLLVTETCLTQDGRPVLHARNYHRGDIFSFNFLRR